MWRTPAARTASPRPTLPGSPVPVCTNAPIPVAATQPPVHRGLSELVGDLGRWFTRPPPSTVRTCWSARRAADTSPFTFAVAHPDDIAGIVLVEVPSPFVDPPPEIGDIPVTVISNDYGPDAEFPGERANVDDQQGWLILDPHAEQIVVTTGHAVEEQDPQLVIDAILDVVIAASSEPTERTTGTNDPGAAAGVDTSVGAMDVTIFGSWHRPQTCQEVLAGSRKLASPSPTSARCRTSSSAAVPAPPRATSAKGHKDRWSTPTSSPSLASSAPMTRTATGGRWPLEASTPTPWCFHRRQQVRYDTHRRLRDHR